MVVLQLSNAILMASAGSEIVTACQPIRQFSTYQIRTRGLIAEKLPWRRGQAGLQSQVLRHHWST